MECISEVEGGVPIFSIVYHGKKLQFRGKTAMINYMRRNFKTTTIEWITNKRFNKHS